jgi:hypothetical protein
MILSEVFGEIVVAVGIFEQVHTTNAVSDLPRLYLFEYRGQVAQLESREQ